MGIDRDIYFALSDEEKGYLSKLIRDVMAGLISTLRSGGVPDDVIAQEIEQVLRSDGFQARVYR